MPIVGNSLFVNGGGQGLQQGEAVDFLHIGAHVSGRVLILDQLLACCDTDAAWEHGPWKALNRVVANHWRDREVVCERVDEGVEGVVVCAVACSTRMLQRHTCTSMRGLSSLNAWFTSVPPEHQQVAETLRDQVVWTHDMLSNSNLPLSMLTVRQVSAMLMQPVVARRVE
jgi:hypothetical protein